MSRVFVFGGPSLPPSNWPKSVYLRPPAERGDLPLLAEESIVVLLDGVFLHRPAPTHRDLLQLLESGVVLIGAASMGALRAAELRDYGMLGLGIIYEAILAGILMDDSELAVGFSPYDLTAATVPLINVRRLLALACEEGLMEDDAARAFHLATTIYFLSRTPEALQRVWSGLPAPATRRLFPMIRAPRIDMKKADARMAIEFALSRLADRNAEPARNGSDLAREIWFDKSRVTFSAH